MDCRMKKSKGSPKNRGYVWPRYVALHRSGLPANLELLEEQSPGAYLLVNVLDLTYAVGKNYDKAFEAYKKRFAIMPNPEGITFLGQRLSSKPR